MFWDFISLRPETTHQVSFLFSDRGIPDGYRHMNGYGSHTYKMINKDGKMTYCKFHFKVRMPDVKFFCTIYHYCLLLSAHELIHVTSKWHSPNLFIKQGVVSPLVEICYLTDFRSPTLRVSAHSALPY